MLTLLELQPAILQAIADTVSTGIIVAEAPSGRIIRSNARLDAMLGYGMTVGRIAGDAAYPCFHPDGRAMEQSEYPLTLALAGQTTAGRVCQAGRADGSRLWVRINAAPVLSAAGAVVGAVAAISDIQDEHEAQAILERTVATRTAALARVTARIQALFDHSPVDIMVLQVARDGSVAVEEANDAYCRTTGHIASHLRAKLVEAALGSATGALLADDCRAALQQGGYECQRVLTFPRGERLVRANYRVLPNEVEGIRRVLLTQTDLTEIRRVEAALRQAMRLEAIGQLTGGIAHDFNNLLTAIMGSLELLGSRITDERQQRWVGRALTAAQRGATLTHQLLAYARKQFLAPVATDIQAAVSGMGELIRGSLGGRIGLVIDLAPGTWRALADPAQLELVLINLVVNARDAMVQGGTLSVSTDNVSAAGSGLPAELEVRDYVRLSVADTGVGMAPEVLARAMEPFFTTKGIGEGSGLGLSQAYGYARQLGGTLRLTSAAGVGTTAEIYLPRAA